MARTNHRSFSTMFLHVHFQGSSRAERPDAFGMRADEFLHSSVDEEEVIHQFLIHLTVRATNRTSRLPFVNFQMRQQMESVSIGVRVETLTANAAAFGGR